MARTRLCKLAMFAAIVFAAGTTQAQESGVLCVKCLEPDVTYRCQARAAAEHEVFLSNKALVRSACIRKIADSSGHATCAVSKKQPKVCTGQTFVVDLSQMAKQYVERVPGSVRKVLGGGPAKPKAEKPDDKNAPPKTVVEFAKRSVADSNKQLKKAGEAVENAGKAVSDAGKAVGDTVQQTWQCLASLFQDC